MSYHEDFDALRSWDDRVRFIARVHDPRAAELNEGQAMRILADHTSYPSGTVESIVSQLHTYFARADIELREALRSKIDVLTNRNNKLSLRASMPPDAPCEDASPLQQWIQRLELIEQRVSELQERSGPLLGGDVLDVEWQRYCDAANDGWNECIRALRALP